MPVTELAWIEATGVARLLAAEPLLYAAVSALHILGIATLFGAILAVDLRLLGVLGDRIDGGLPTLVRLALTGFGVAALSGAAMASVRIVDYAANPAFLAKLGILAAAAINAVLLRLVAGRVDGGAIEGRAPGRPFAAVSLALWLGAVTAGRMIAFV